MKARKVLLFAAIIAALNIETLGQAVTVPHGTPKSILTKDMPAIELTLNPDIEAERTAEVKPPAYIKNIPLSEELQTYTYEKCKEYGVPYNLILAVMQIESGFNTETVSKTSDYGIMQINECNHGWLKKIGVDVMTTRGNIEAGILMLSDLMKYEDLHLALMAYNHGEAGAQKKWVQGITESSYSKKVIAAYNDFEAQ
jgi:soluble lytic murein transglycosylase-like protein